MRYALISDVHANLPALRAVLADAEDLRVEKIIVLGDVLGYGPDPVEALELVYRKAHVCLAGNHDDAVCGRFPVEDFTDFAAAAVSRHRNALGDKAIRWLRTLPHECEFRGFACAHGDFSDPKNFNYILDAEHALPSWRERNEPLLFVGHTHEPCIFVLGASGTPHKLGAADFTLEDGKRYIVNPGSVGYPRSGSNRSTYCLFDDESQSVFFRSLPFDYESYSVRMQGKGLAEAPWMAARALARRIPEVRAGTEFGAESIVREPPAAKALRPGPPVVITDVANERMSWRWTLIAAATILGVAGLVCTLRLTESMPSAAERRAVEEVSVPTVPESGGGTKAGEIQLHSGWKAEVSDPSRQKVRVNRNEKKNETVFRIEHDGEQRTVFRKRIPLTDRPEKLLYTVRLITSTRPGQKEKSRLSWKIVFFGDDGRELDYDAGTSKKSSTGKTTVPEGAAEAEMSVEVRCAGNVDLEVPYFAGQPPAAKRR